MHASLLRGYLEINWPDGDAAQLIRAPKRERRTALARGRRRTLLTEGAILSRHFSVAELLEHKKAI